MSRFANLEQMEMTFTIEDADLDKLNNVLKDINVRECPWFEVHDKHGNKAKYYREPHWIPCSERMPEECEDIIVTYVDGEETRIIPVNYGKGTWYDCIFDTDLNPINVIAWMPLPEPYKESEL